MPRVTTGKAKGRQLEVPKISGMRVTQDVMKLAVFSILGQRVNDSKCLDLYAGSGSLGIEAISRGARKCDFVDSSRLAEQTIRMNLRKLGLSIYAKVIMEDSLKYVLNTIEKYDIIFIDPFYHEKSHKHLLKNLNSVLNSGGIVCFSHAGDLKIKELLKGTELEVFTERKYGNAYLTILKKTSQISGKIPPS